MASNAQANDDALELLDTKDVEVLLNETGEPGVLNLSELEELDDLDSLKSDVAEDVFAPAKKKSIVPGSYEDSKAKKKSIVDTDTVNIDEMSDIIIDEEIPDGTVVNDLGLIQKGKSETALKKPEIFDLGSEEDKLLELSKYVESKIPAKEWSQINSGGEVEKYVVQEGDWLWKITQKLFGSGFYYSKIWSLNPLISNPHEIEPGMTLAFDTGSENEIPQVQVGSFSGSSDEQADVILTEIEATKKREAGKKYFDFADFGDSTEPPWLKERQKLIEQGVFFQFASHETYSDLSEIGKVSLRTEYKKYEPPIPNIVIQEPGEEYDDAGFDKNSKVTFEVREGFFLNTFITTNIVQDLGEIEAKPGYSVFIQKFERIFLRLDKSVKVKPGDMFSIYKPGGKVSHSVSDRSGFKYTVTGQVKVIKKSGHVWECEVTDVSGIVRRSDRITVFTPKINKITKTFNRRNIEAAVLSSFADTANGMSFGDVLYLDRGRADGVEMGNVFELFSFHDRGTGKRISTEPAYKIGEVTIISLSDNFSTALITSSHHEIPVGSIALSKTEEQAARATRLRNGKAFTEIKGLEGKALEELDVELNLDNLSEDLLDQADKVQLTEDELEELERQEREKSIIKDHERDLKELERLEAEILEAETSLNEQKVDEDKFLEQQDLNSVENNTKKKDANAFESMNDVEQDIGRKYMDEDINSKENPYGLTEFDLEEIDELLNTGP